MKERAKKKGTETEKVSEAASTAAKEPIKRTLRYVQCNYMYWQDWYDEARHAAAAAAAHRLNNISFHIYFLCFKRMVLLLGTTSGERGCIKQDTATNYILTLKLIVCNSSTNSSAI